MADFSSFSNYKQTVMDITLDLKKLREYSQKMELEGNIAAIDDVLKRLSDDTFSIAIVGEFKRGKSTLINALLGKDVLPTDVLPCSAALNKIKYSIKPFVQIEYKDGKTEEIETDQLSNYVTKLTKESEERARSVKEATVYYPVNYCKNGITIIDTPGLNDDAAMTEVTMSVLPQIDAALMVIMAQAPFSESERDFLESKIITSDLGRVLFVVTGVDLLDEEDVVRVLDNIKQRIGDHVITKAKNMYGEDSKEFETYKSKIGNVKVFGLSAKKALRAKLKGDDSMLEQSFFPEFEKALESFLTEDRGAIMLSVPVNKIKTSAVEITKAITLRENVLSMNAEDFNEKYKLAIDEIDRIRDDRKKEFSKINEASQRTYVELIPAIQNYWPALEKVASETIDNFSMTNEDIKGTNVDSTQEKLLNAVKNALARESQFLSERVQEYISIALENEAERISGFEEHFYNATNKIQELFVTMENKDNDNLSITNTVGYAITNSLTMGISSIFMGFKQSGWKGALIGGATGFGAFTVALATVSLAIPILWPAMIIAGVASAFAARFSLGIFTSGDKTESYKEAFKENILNELAAMKSQNDFSETVKSQIEMAFEALKNKINTETEHILSDTQNQLTNLKVDLSKATILGDKEKEEMKQMISEIDNICAGADEMSKQLAAVFSK